jgi:hypothetical protein
VWNRKPRVLLRKQGTLVLDVFKGHLPSQVRYVIHVMITDLVVIPGVMTSRLHILINKKFDTIVF